MESDLVSSCDGGSGGAASVDFDNGDFFFGTDFDRLGSWGKCESRVLGSFSRIMRDGLDGLDVFSKEGAVETLDNELDTRRWPGACLGGMMSNRAD